MKHLLLTLTIVCFAIIGAQAQETESAKTDSIIFEQEVYDYGTIEQGSDGLCVFKFTNKGKAPLVLSNVRASCGCTTPKWTREPVQPGEEGIIEVKYNTRILGNFNKSIRVTSNAANSVVVLRIKGKVESAT
jgi:hypothetical protein